MAHATAPTSSSLGRPTSPVFDSFDLMKQCLDFLDAPSVWGARPTSTVLRAAGSAVPGRITLSTFDSINATLSISGHRERDPDYHHDYDSDDSRGFGYEYVVDTCTIEDYYYGDLDESYEPKGPKEDDLKDLIVLVAPEIIFEWGGSVCPDSGSLEAPNGKWFTVGDLFKAIAKREADIRCHESDHIFFEGISAYKGPVGQYGISVHWGS